MSEEVLVYMLKRSHCAILLSVVLLGLWLFKFPCIYVCKQLINWVTVYFSQPHSTGALVSFSHVYCVSPRLLYCTFITPWCRHFHLYYIMSRVLPLVIYCYTACSCVVLFLKMLKVESSLFVRKYHYHEIIHNYMHSYSHGNIAQSTGLSRVS